MNASQTCTASGCDLPIKSLGLCIKHYTRLRNHGDINHVRQRKPLAERLAARLVPSTTTQYNGTACLEFSGARLPRGYGKIGRPGGENWVLTHRAAFEIHHGVSLPQDVLVCHHCDNPPCCNPAHLFIGTHADNNRDCITKGRAVVFGRKVRARG